MRALAITGMETACWMLSIMSGSDMRDTPPSRRMSAGTRSSAMTAQAPASSAILAWSAVTTSMMTPPFSISAKPRFTWNVPVTRAPAGAACSLIGAMLPATSGTTSALLDDDGVAGACQLDPGAPRGEQDRLAGGVFEGPRIAGLGAGPAAADDLATREHPHVTRAGGLRLWGTGVGRARLVVDEQDDDVVRVDLGAALVHVR